MKITYDWLKDHLHTKKPDSIIINTSRGGIFNEHDLYEVMYSGHLSGTAIDVLKKNNMKAH